MIDEVAGVSGVSELSDFSFDEDPLKRTVRIKITAKLFDQREIYINETVEI